MSGEIYPNDTGDIKIRELFPGTAIEVEIITLRDRFAMAALNAIMREVGIVRGESMVSEVAYKYADAMMAARETKKPEAR